MNRVEFRQALEEIRDEITTALELDGKPALRVPIPGVPQMRALDLSKTDDQRTLLLDLSQDIRALMDALLRGTQGRDGDSN